MKLLTKERGITLVALVVTVIILLIIAGVAVSMITGNDGLFSKANDAGTRYNESAQNEADEISQMLEWGESKIPEDADLVIRTVEEFVAFRDSVNSGNTYENKKIYLMNNLNLKNVCSKEIGSFGEIGNATTGIYFKGIFEGQGHIISNLYISENRESTGLFRINYGTIKNLILDEFYVRSTCDIGTTFTGAVAGMNYGDIFACATINGKVLSNGESEPYTRYTGGITGTNNGTIEQSCNTSYVYGTNAVDNGNSQARTGGIVGMNHKKINDCYNAGKIVTANGKNAYAAGIAATSNLDGSEIRRCYNWGEIRVISGIKILPGGVVGPITQADDTQPSVVANIYCLDITPIAYFNKHDPTTGVSDGVKTEEELKSDALLLELGSAFIKDTNGINGGYPILVWQKNWKNTKKEIIPDDADLVIRSASDLANFRDSVNAGNTYENQKVYLVSDINLYKTCSSTLGSFGQIGNKTDGYYFKGTFDALGHTISGLYILESGPWTGLFTNNYGTIQNLIIDNFYVRTTCTTATMFTGGLVGRNYGTIQNCGTVNGSVYANGSACNFIRYTGGVVGENNGLISSCYNASYVYGNNGTSGDSSQARSGGIVGTNHKTIEDCYNSGTVVVNNGKYTMAGGIAATTNQTGSSISRCYNWGKVSITAGGSKLCAGVAGTIIKSDSTQPSTVSKIYCLNTNTYCYYALQTTSSGKTAGVKTKSELQSATVLNDLGSAFVRDTDGINGGYPILAWQVTK